MELQKLLVQLEQLEQERRPLEAIWQECAFYLLPNKWREQKGDKLPSELYDSVGILSLQIFASGLQGYLVNPSQRWFALSMHRRQGGEVIRSRESAQALKDLEDRIFQVFAETGFYGAVHEVWLDLGAFGNGVLYSEADPVKGANFFSRPVWEVYISENARGVVDTVFRTFKMTVRQLVETFEGAVSEQVASMYASGRLEEKVEVVHAVFPNPEYDPTKVDVKPYLSIYFEKQTKKVLSDGRGYWAFPFHVARFSRMSGSIWGYGPGMNVLPDLKTLNVMVKDILEASEMAIWPPIEMPADGYVLPVSLKPRSVVIRNRSYAGEGMRPILTVGNLAFGEAEAEKRRQAVRQAFFTDLFLLLAEAKMTATEVVKRIEERMLLLGPVLGRLMGEFLTPLISRVLELLLRQGLAQIPEWMEEYEIVYTSPLAKAQKMSEITGVQNFLALAQAVGQIAPESLDMIDFDAIIEDLARILQVNPAYLRDEKSVQAIREMRAYLMQAGQNEQAGENQSV